MDMEYLTTKILTQYPDIGQITKLYSELRKRGESAVFVNDGEEDVALAGDGKCRPPLLLLAVLYKLQERNDEFFRTGGLDVNFSDHKKAFELLGYFWHQGHHLGKMLREGINKAHSMQEISQLVDKNKQKIVDVMKLNVTHVSVSELCLENENAVAVAGKPLVNHTPDFVIHVNHNHRTVVLTILGRDAKRVSGYIY